MPGRDSGSITAAPIAFKKVRNGTALNLANRVMKRPGVQIVSATVAVSHRKPVMIQNSMFPMFFISDALRRSLGSLFDGAGLAPQQASWRVVLDQSDFRLRRYGRQGAPAGPVLIVPAPIKRPYIFDLLPEVSIIRRLTEAGFSVYLTQWREQKSATADLGKYVGSLGIALEKIAVEHGRAPILIGHSLGGTLAAILAALEPDRVDKLVLIEAPLKFGEHTGALGPITLYPDSWLFGGTVEPIPGTLLDLASVAAAPDEFSFGHWSDAWASLPDAKALAIHSRVIRWTLDEFAPPAALLQNVVDFLYRKDLFARNELRLLGRLAGSAALAEIPTAAVIWPRVIEWMHGNQRQSR
ncbi:MAG: alpha/beta fold hydrolase [Alphaproteobacteria bacterium]|nr:MAG: alpha/beta fold hydrolase [Alphaproteobacteria bacterium]